MVLASSKRDAPLLELRGVSKAFGGVQALDDVSLTLNGGEILALVGENGAGKSTLMRVLAGVHAPDAGDLLLDSERLSLSGPRDAMAVGIGLIHQELCLCDNLSVEENIVLGREPRRRGLVDRAAMQVIAEEALARVGLEVSPKALVESLPLGQQQLVEVAKALSLDARILVFDEPTSALTESEAAHLMEVVRGLRSEGVAIVWISHRLREVVSAFAQQELEEAERGVVLLQQTHWGSLAETVNDCVKLCRAVNRPNFGLTFEPANLLACGESLDADVVKRLSPYIRNVYFQNIALAPESNVVFPTRSRGPVGIEFLPLFDERGIDLAPILSAVKEYVAEPLWFTLHQPQLPGQDLEQAIREAGRFAAQF